MVASLAKLTFSECGNHTVEVKKGGTLEIHDIGGGNGTVTSTGAEVTVLTHSLFLGTRHCIFVTNGTDIGQLTGSRNTGGTATVTAKSAPISQTLTGELCGNDAAWTADYKITSPDYLDVDEGYSGTTATSPAGTKVEAGTQVKAESDSAFEVAGEVSFSCQKSTLEGTVGNAGGGNATVSVSVTKQTLSECGNTTVQVLKPGSLEIHDIGGGNGTVTSTGAEVTALTHGLFLGTRHCIYVTNNTDLGTVTGSRNTGETARIDIGPTPIAQVATDSLCGNDAQWGGSYKVTSPDYLDVD